MTTPSFPAVVFSVTDASIAELEIEMRKMTDGIVDSGFFVNPNQTKQVRNEH